MDRNDLSTIDFITLKWEAGILKVVPSEAAGPVAADDDSTAAASGNQPGSAPSTPAAASPAASPPAAAQSPPPENMQEDERSQLPMPSFSPQRQWPQPGSLSPDHDDEPFHGDDDDDSSSLYSDQVYDGSNLTDADFQVMFPPPR